MSTYEPTAKASSLSLAEPTRSGQRVWLGLALSFLVCFGASAVGGFFTSTSVGGWYLEINRPSWNPPGWVFGPVWGTLYASMAIAAWGVWRNSSKSRSALTVFAVQLALNVLWSVAFFGLQSPGLAFVEILLLIAAIVVTTVKFYRCNKSSGLLLLPYLLWTTFAAVLNGTIWWMNRGL